MMIIALAGAIALGGCADQRGGQAANAGSQAANAPGCTDTWSGRGGDSDYLNGANWSTGLAPSNGTNACIPPGGYAVVRSLPAEPAASLVIEGTLCLLDPPNGLATSITNGVPSGARPMQPLPGGASSKQCPPGTMLSFNGGVSRASPRQAQPSTPSQPSPGQAPNNFTDPANGMTA
jgi:hypothetical protein